MNQVEVRVMGATCYGGPAGPGDIMVGFRGASAGKPRGTLE